MAMCSVKPATVSPFSFSKRKLAQQQPSQMAASAHPALRDAAWAAPSADLAASPPPPWTPDMDDMLRLIIRHRAFRFDEVRMPELTLRAQALRSCQLPSLPSLPSLACWRAGN